MFTPYIYNFGFICFFAILAEKSRLTDPLHLDPKCIFVTEKHRHRNEKQLILKIFGDGGGPDPAEPDQKCKKLVICIWHLDSSVAGLVF